MKTRIAHHVFNVQPQNMPFYKNLLSTLGWNIIYDGTGDDGVPMLGAVMEGQSGLYFVGATKAVTNDYDGPGLNHLAFGTDTQAEVDVAAKTLQDQGVVLLFETPRHRPEFSESEANTYYQIMFESPDKLLFEVVYTGPKS